MLPTHLCNRIQRHDLLGALEKTEGVGWFRLCQLH